MSVSSSAACLTRTICPLGINSAARRAAWAREEQAAAAKTARHADTPTIDSFRQSGQTFLVHQSTMERTRTATTSDIPPERARHRGQSARMSSTHSAACHALRLRHARNANPSGKHGGRRAMDAERRYRQARSAPGTAENMPFARNTTRCVDRCNSFVQGGDPSDPNAEFLSQAILFERTIYGDSPDTGLTEASTEAGQSAGQVRSGFTTAPASSPMISMISRATREARNGNSHTTIRTLRIGLKAPR